MIDRKLYYYSDSYPHIELNMRDEFLSSKEFYIILFENKLLRNHSKLNKRATLIDSFSDTDDILYELMKRIEDE